MHYFCFIPTAGAGQILRVTEADWRAFGRRIEDRYPVSVHVEDGTGPPPLGKFWFFAATARTTPDQLTESMVRRISREIDAFIEPRKQPLPQAA